AASKAAERVGRDIERLERFVARFRASTEKMARKAQVKLTQIERLERERAKSKSEVDLLTRKTRSLGFEFLKPARSGRTVLEVEGLGLRIGERVLLEGASFAIERGEHVALVGPNGSGKTTLLETILEKRDPQGGTVRLGHGVVPAYFSQQELELDLRGSVLQCVQRATGLQRPEAQKLLGRFLFSGWTEHEKKAGAPKPREGPSELERIEAEIAARERGVADLEDRLAKDWNDVDLLAAHRSARDELQTLLQRWERLFERAHS